MKVPTTCDKGMEVLITDRTFALHLPQDTESAADPNTLASCAMIHRHAVSGSEETLTIEYIRSCSAGTGDSPISVSIYNLFKWLIEKTNPSYFGLF
jgi:hypothetical protein